MYETTVLLFVFCEHSDQSQRFQIRSGVSNQMNIESVFEIKAIL